MTSLLNYQSSGIPGLDELLNGGYVEGRLYLVRGRPGAGKTLVGQHFLEAGLENDETVVYIHGEESREDILQNAAQLGIDLERAEFLDLGPDTDFFVEDVSYDLVDPADVEAERFTEDVKNVIDGFDPTRVFIDPITQFRYVEPNEHQYRKRLLSFMRFLRERDTTVVATVTLGTETREAINSVSDGIIDLVRGDGGTGRRIRVTKHRGVGQKEGTQGLEIREQGIEVYPQLDPRAGERVFDPELLSTGLPTMDSLLGGGIERGSVTFLSGPSGVGKSTMAAQFCSAMATPEARGDVYLFEESVEQFLHRADGLDVSIVDAYERGAVAIREVEPLERSAEEFANVVRRRVTEHETEFVMIDGIDGYTLSIQGDQDQLVRRLHALTRHLTNSGVTVLVTDEVGEITGVTRATSTDTSYVADNLVFLSYVEVDGRLERVVGVLKKRIGDFDNTFHRFDFEEGRLRIVGPLRGATGVLQGTPQLADDLSHEGEG